MLRTQIYLPEYEYKKLKAKAKKEDKTLAQTIRDLLAAGFKKEEAKLQKAKKKKLSGGEFLLSLAEEAERMGFEGPADMSTTIDETLYGKKKKK